MADTAAHSDLAAPPPTSAVSLRSGATRLWSTAKGTSWAIVGVTTLAAIACGSFFADGRTKYGAALVLGAIYAPLAFFDLSVALALWTAVLFVKDLHSLSVGPNAMGVLLALGFIGAIAPRWRTLPVLAQQRRLIIGTVLFASWLTISTAWAEQPGTAASDAGFWWLAVLAFLITMTTLRGPRDIGLVALAFVVGATVAALIGLKSGGLYTPSPTNSIGQTAVNGRLTGGGGDPNLQAAGFIAAMFLIMGLMAVYSRRAARIGLLAAFAVVTVAFFATQSRGGLLALGVAAIAALVLFPAQRRQVVGFVVLGVVIAGVVVASHPGALGRITDFGGGTSGRSDIWAVAIKVSEQRPLIGVGLDNFQVVEPRFALLHQGLTRVTYIAETPYPAHNTYLQLLADTGVIGLVGFLAIVIGSLRAAWLAARLFDQTSRPAYAHLARASLMGTIAMLTAIIFVSDGPDWRLWILLGLGPALLAFARTAPGPEAVAVAPPRWRAADVNLTV